jgi:broad specificity phosphatase PhoE
MTRLLLVRHGQASAGASDYDELSPLGREQSRQLGRWLGRRGKAPTHVLVGPRKRHRDTWAELAEAYHAETGLVLDGEPVEGARPSRFLPSPTRLDALDEHHGIQLLMHVAPTLATREDPLGRAARRAFSGGPQARRAYVDLILLLLPAWARGEVTHPDVESWDAFLVRARELVLRFGELPENAHVWAITSGGLISTVIGEALGAPLETTFELMFATRNTAMSELSLRHEDGRPKLSLFSFNTLPHLDDEAHVTFV